MLGCAGWRGRASRGTPCTGASHGALGHFIAPSNVPLQPPMFQRKCALMSGLLTATCARTREYLHASPPCPPSVGTRAWSSRTAPRRAASRATQLSTHQVYWLCAAYILRNITMPGAPVHARASIGLCVRMFHVGRGKNHTADFSSARSAPFSFFTYQRAK